jgi:hypothetical protein
MAIVTENLAEEVMSRRVAEPASALSEESRCPFQIAHLFGP